MEERLSKLEVKLSHAIKGLLVLKDSHNKLVEYIMEMDKKINKRKEQEENDGK